MSLKRKTPPTFEDKVSAALHEVEQVAESVHAKISTIGYVRNAFMEGYIISRAYALPKEEAYVWWEVLFRVLHGNNATPENRDAFDVWVATTLIGG